MIKMSHQTFTGQLDTLTQKMVGVTKFLKQWLTNNPENQLTFDLYKCNEGDDFTLEVTIIYITEQATIGDAETDQGDDQEYLKYIRSTRLRS